MPCWSSLSIFLTLPIVTKTTIKYKHTLSPSLSRKSLRKLCSSAWTWIVQYSLSLLNKYISDLYKGDDYDLTSALIEKLNWLAYMHSLLYSQAWLPIPSIDNVFI